MQVVLGVRTLGGLVGCFHFQRKVLRHQSLGKLTVAFLALAVLGVGCTKASMYHSRFTPTDLALKDAITVIQVQSGEQEYSDKLEKKVVGCIKDALEDTHPTVRVVPPEEFRQVAFPDLTPEEIQSGDWEQLLEDPAFRERIAPLGLHYLIAVTGGTTQNTKFVAEGVPFYGGAMGFMGDIGDRRSSVHATVLDLERGKEVGSVDASAYNTSGFGWVILPLPLYVPPPPTEARACSELGEGLAKFLAGEKLPQEGIWPALADEGEEIGSRPDMAEQLPKEIEAEQLEEEIREEWKKTKGEDQQAQFIGHGYGHNPFE
jgi:hypothetical protein